MADADTSLWSPKPEKLNEERVLPTKHYAEEKWKNSTLSWQFEELRKPVSVDLEQTL